MTADHSTPAAAGDRAAGAPPARPPRGTAARAGEAVGLTGVMSWVALLLFTRWCPFGIAPIPNRDSAAYALAGSLLRGGGVPYVTYWDHKPIVIHLINAAGLSLGGGHVAGIWVLSLAATVGAVALLHLAVRERLGVAASLFGALFFGTSLIGVVEQGNFVEQYALPLQAAAVLLLARWSAARAAGSRAAFTPGLALGALATLAFLLRQNLIGAAVGVGLVVAALLVRERDHQALLGWVAGGIVAVALGAVSVYGYLRVVGAWDAFVDQAFHYNFIYAAAPMRARVWSALAGVQALSPYNLSLALAGWLTAVVRLRRGGNDPAVVALLLLAVVWPPIELGLATTSGRSYPHYFMPLLPALTLGAAIFMAEISDLVTRSSLEPARRREAALLPRLLAIAIAVTAVAPPLVRLAGRGFRVEITEYQTKIAAAGEYVRRHVPEGSSIFVWGAEPDIYRVSGRRPASRFIYAYPLVTAGYTDTAVVSRFIEDVRRSRPVLLIDTSADSPVPSLARWQPGTRTGPHVLVPELEAWYDFVASGYTLAGDVRGWKIYRRIEPVATVRLP
jgi:4-amino-4-deoxy-L-arabinose transferase-like glycosyltransferase